MAGLKKGTAAAKAIVQMLFTTAQSFTLDGLREKLREFYKTDTRAESRALAALSTIELVTALLESNQLLDAVGLQLRISNGVVSLLTTRVENPFLADYLRDQTLQSGNPQLSTAVLEVLACIAFKQPIGQAEIDRLFDADKRSLVARLRELGLVEDFAGPDGRLRFVTTGAFLLRFGLASLEELRQPRKQWD